MFWETLEDLLKSLPNYYNHAVTKTYQDGNTIEVAVWLVSGADVERRTYVVKTQLTEAGREVLGYKRVL